ncbi:hypothetical protein Ccrd_019901 [Cynara cardunculus var. scolymus]|uniref:Uncharacterized protein n=1 Tax=Cynara cardunculus var. scolymus TaxID=59895 RepID=A0A103Y3F7_CYNCS|nr:hypothetical protein Ccrd_019901 [Cynara cardunculus var. scolymus]
MWEVKMAEGGSVVGSEEGGDTEECSCLEYLGASPCAWPAGQECPCKSEFDREPEITKISDSISTNEIEIELEKRAREAAAVTAATARTMDSNAKKPETHLAYK